MWSTEVGDPGIVTDPRLRGRGHGTTATSALLEWAFGQSWLVLYQTLRANHPAVRIARSLGFREYASHLAVQLRAG